MIIDNRKRLLTTPELADILGVSARHLWHLEKEGKVSSIRLGTSVRYDLEDVLLELKNASEEA